MTAQGIRGGSAPPTAIVVLTGSELTRGETVDANGSFLCAELTSLGVRVDEVRLAPDDVLLLERTFRDAIARADVVLISGGLGPTADDLTVEVLARILGTKIIRDPEALRRMRERALKRVGSEENIPANFYKQAEVIEGGEVLLNPVGLAPGSLVTTERGLVATLPGVPRELRAMFHERLALRLRERLPLQPPRIVRALVIGQAESWAEARVQGLGIDFRRVEYGISARPGQLLLKFVAHAPPDFGYLDEVRAKLAREFGPDCILLPEGLITPGGGRVAVDHAVVVHERLLAAGVTVATAESCTGGLIAELLTQNPGSSAYFRGAIVAYHNDAKRELLGVAGAVLEEHGAVSAEVCSAMAAGARVQFGADFAVSTTGVAGPGGGSPEKPVGLVFVGLAARQGEPAVTVERHHLFGDRDAVRAHAATRALELLRRRIASAGGGV